MLPCAKLMTSAASKWPAAAADEKMAEATDEAVVADGDADLLLTGSVMSVEVVGVATASPGKREAVAAATAAAVTSLMVAVVRLAMEDMLGAESGGGGRVRVRAGELRADLRWLVLPSLGPGDGGSSL